MLAALAACVYASADLPDYEIITSPSPVSAYGSITRIAVNSENLGGRVIVDVWTPAGYDSEADTAYPVVYAHDGQNLFDATFTFAGVPWGVDKACSQLAAENDFVMPIVVGINNRGAEGLRPNDYFPEKALDYISPDRKDDTFVYDTCDDNFLGDEEAAFVVKELKPLVDNMFNTAPGVSTTFAMGSSMGALASVYLMCEYPDVFGAAACLSTHWIGSLSLNADYTMNDDEVCARAILQYLGEHLPSDGNHRLYMDQGTKDWDAGYLKYEVIAREIARDNGYTEENSRLSVYDAKGAGHNEWYWQQRVKMPLRFLLSKSAIESAGITDVVAGSADRPEDERVFDLSGRCRSLSGPSNLPGGVYIVKGKKFIKRD